ncbi:MAG: adenylate/guanylate cyclase domain-containing protein [Treponema sp.]|jgi:class 3 adenylate cyclase|nr:adenylate/guanylate cyclase domain-containing protein [Treponema sp.]
MNFKQFLKGNVALLLFFVSSLIILLLSINANINLNRTVGLMETSIHEFLLASAYALSEHVSAEELDKYHTIEDVLTPAGLEAYHANGDALTGEEEFVPEYKALKERLVAFAERYQVLYAYFWRPYGDARIQYIVDNDYSEDVCTPALFFPLENISVEVINEKVGVTTHFDEYTLTWDGLITGLVPLYDEAGKLYCIAGVDIGDERILSQRDATRQRYILQVIAIAATILTTGTLFLLYRQKITQLNVFNANLQVMVEEETKKVLALNETFGRYLSDEIVKDLLESPEGLALGGKKQNITIMFTDIRGFTSMSEQMEVEDAVTMLNHYFSIMVDVIHKYRGTVIEFLGDGILAIFGAPVAYVNHTDSAVACSLEMQIAMDEVNDWNSKNGFSILEMGIGINTGETIVGNIGSPKSMKYNVIGSNVNLASRIETFSTGGQILLSEQSYKAVETDLHVVQTVEVMPKGVKTPLSVYQIDGIGAPYFIELKGEETPLTRLPTPLPITCFRIDDKKVEIKQHRYYMLSVSNIKAIIIAGKGEDSLEIFENIKMINAKGEQVFAKVIRKSHEGVIIVRFTSDAEDFIGVPV